MLGGEASVGALDQELQWIGPYVDLVRDFAIDRSRIGLGVEAGIGPVGFDGGLAFDWVTGDRDGTVRFVVTGGLLAVYARGLAFEDGQRFGELGVLVKLPRLKR